MFFGLRYNTAAGDVFKTMWEERRLARLAMETDHCGVGIAERKIRLATVLYVAVVVVIITIIIIVMQSTRLEKG